MGLRPPAKNSVVKTVLGLAANRALCLPLTPVVGFLAIFEISTSAVFLLLTITAVQQRAAALQLPLCFSSTIVRILFLARLLAASYGFLGVVRRRPSGLRGFFLSELGTSILLVTHLPIVLKKDAHLLTAGVATAAALTLLTAYWTWSLLIGVTLRHPTHLPLRPNGSLGAKFAASGSYGTLPSPERFTPRYPLLYSNGYSAGGASPMSGSRIPQSGSFALRNPLSPYMTTSATPDGFKVNAPPSPEMWGTRKPKSFLSSASTSDGGLGQSMEDKERYGPAMSMP